MNEQVFYQPMLEYEGNCPFKDLPQSLFMYFNESLEIGPISEEEFNGNNQPSTEVSR